MRYARYICRIEMNFVVRALRMKIPCQRGTLIKAVYREKSEARPSYTTYSHPFIHFSRPFSLMYETRSADINSLRKSERARDRLK